MFELAKVNSLELGSSEILQKGIFLWIWQPEKTPPHIGISTDGVYFSLQFEKMQFELSVQNLFEIIERKQTSIMWLKIQVENQNIRDIFLNYVSCSLNNCSCIQPILDVFSIRKKDAILPDLLESLESKGIVGKLFHSYLPKKFTQINSYTREDVMEHLLNLQT
jgi:hypothetical protein